MALVRPFPVIETKTRRLPSTSEKALYYKIARIQSRNPIDSGEGSVFQGQLFPQSNFGMTGTVQPLYMFSFGVRNNSPTPLIKPSLLKVGDSRDDSYRFEIYKDAEGFHNLYLVQSPYSKGAVFVYHAFDCTEYWEVDMHLSERGYTLAWSSVNGDTQGIYEGGRRLLTEQKASQLYTPTDDSKSIQVSLDTGISSPFYHFEEGLRVTKEGNNITINGTLQHGHNGKYLNIAKVPPGYEPKYKTLLSGAYSQADGVFISIPLVVKPDGYIVMMNDRINTANPTNMYVSGSWILKY
ncbi:hypothetical protein [Bacillus mycoides]|uniref:Uncharacterized protein n=1 Tax=Bacillus mycoides TaxID=1405 RepID=A0A4U3AD50_BACMY|nr:hypothetical protein [Bacillus mycoides]TKI85422.1 hypothetical protein FC701_10155 [Bacillus mycoides]